MIPGLFDYQIAGARWLSNKRYALLADEMGLGKSAQTIVAAGESGLFPALVLCPAVARVNWQREFLKFSPRTLNISVLLTAADAKQSRSSDVTICSYDLATNPAVFSELRARRWSLLVLDEAHFLKEPEATRTRTVFGKDGLVHLADKAWCLTGTPAPNNPSELWVMLYCLGVTKLDYAAFTDRYTKQIDIEIRPGQWRKKVVDGRNIDELKTVLAPFTLRRLKRDVMKELPPLRFNDVVVEPSKVGRDLQMMYFESYVFQPHQLEKDIEKARNLVEGLIDALGTGAKEMKILEGLDGRQEVKSLRKWTGLTKVPAVIEMVAAELEANAYPKIVLFGVHKAVLDELEAGLKKFGTVKIFGGTPAHKRDRLVQKFQTNPKCRVFIGQVVAAGTAINLTAASEVGVVEADWTPGNNTQAIMRCHRIGQTADSVNVRFFSVPGYDERVQRVLKQKSRTLTALFDDPQPADPFS